MQAHIIEGAPLGVALALVGVDVVGAGVDAVVTVGTEAVGVVGGDVVVGGAALVVVVGFDATG